MIELPIKLKRQIENILAAASDAKAIGQVAQGSASADDVPQAESQGAGSSSLLNKRVAEGSTARPVFVDPNGVALQAQSTGNGGVKRAYPSSSSRANNEQPLTEHEKRQLLEILGYEDPNMTMKEINILVDGIKNGTFKDTTFEELRTIIKKVEELGYDVAMGGEDPPVPTPTPAPSPSAPPANDGGSNQGEEPVSPRNPDGNPDANPAAGAGASEEDELQQALGTVSYVQEEIQNVKEEIEDVKEVIQDVRDIVAKVRYHIGQIRLNPAYLSKPGEFKISREIVLTNAFKQEVAAQEEENQERFVQVKNKEKIDRRNEIIEDTAEAELWRRSVTDALDVATEGKKNPEAEVM
jgi:hypothetical protein